ncbi:MAG: UDP-glucose/GDP-mannose dehydrogenase family protein [Synergistaceae bacterium]|nr:UDP-glucose/GDP-mannose dehydrogenase family protein [Synergistaceae bacterium]
MRICMIGTGYVGLVTGACLAEMGNDVWCVDVDEAKIEGLRQGRIPIYEPGLETIVTRNAEQGRLRFTTDLAEALAESLFVFIAVGTPPDGAGAADLRFVFDVARQIGSAMESYKIVVAKSTVPVGTTVKIKETIAEALAGRGRSDLEFDVAFCPEFLKEGSAVDDFMKPDRIVIGTENNRTAELLKELFSFFTFREERMFAMSIASAELTKYAANAMLATRISFMNELARFCERVGADVTEVRRGMGSDGRIGSAFLYAGVGYGGSCFPKDVKALVHSGREAATPFSILEAVEAVNDGQRGWFFEKILRHYGGKLGGKDFALWGLSFKPNTDDVREAPALDLICRLLEAGASVRAYDPVAEENARRTLASCPAVEGALAEGRLRFGPDNYEVLQGADALVLLTEWPLFRKPDWERIRSLLAEPVLFDGRNQYDPARMKAAGFVYHAVGRA